MDSPEIFSTMSSKTLSVWWIITLAANQHKVTRDDFFEDKAK